MEILSRVWRYRVTDFPHLSGVRIVRIAVHPGAQGHGYGSAALDLLTRYCESKLTDMGERRSEENTTVMYGSVIEAAKKVEQLLPLLAHFYFQEKLPVTLTHVEASLLLSMGLQFHDITSIQDQMKLERHQILHIFRKIMVKFYKYFSDVLSKDLDPSFLRDRKVELQPHAVSLEDLNDGARIAVEKLKMEIVGSANPENLQEHKIQGIKSHALLNAEKMLDCDIEGNDEVKETLQRCSRIPPSGVISVNSIRNMENKRKKHEPSTMRTKTRKSSR